MRALKFLLTAMLLAPAPPSLAQNDGRPHDELGTVAVSATDPEMEAAKARARRELPAFLSMLAHPPAGSDEFVIKYPLGGWEQIWVAELRQDGQMLVGRLANHPEQEGYQLGQVVRVPLAKVSDWGYRDSAGVMHGHFTTRVLLGRISPEEAAEVRAAMGW